MSDKIMFKKKPSSFRKGNGADRTIYIPYMCDHAHILAGALSHFGQRAEVLPKPDDSSLKLGRENTNGKECLPFIITTGDILKKTMSADFNPAKSMFFMPATDGPCRFGQYHSLQRILLDKFNLKETLILTPEAKGSFGGFKNVPHWFKRVVWRGIVAVDILHKLLHETRPYETVKGATERAYQQALDIIVEQVKYGGRDIFERMRDVKAIFRTIPLNRGKRRPIIGVVGEIYVRLQNYSNNNIIKQIEEMGGETRVAPFGEWIFYCTDRFIAKSRKKIDIINLMTGKLFYFKLIRDEKRLLAPFTKELLTWEEPTIREVLALANPFLEETLEGEAVLSVGKAIDYLRKGCSGIINLLPFSCMPGTIVTALSPKIKERNNCVPWMNIAFDGMDNDNNLSRLEAFMAQVYQHKEVNNFSLSTCFSKKER